MTRNRDRKRAADFRTGRQAATSSCSQTRGHRPLALSPCFSISALRLHPSSSFRPFLPMRGIDLDRSPQFGINPRIADTTGGENEGMNRPADVNDSQLQIAVCRNVRERIDLVPHAASRARNAPIRFDLAQIQGYVGKATTHGEEAWNALFDARTSGTIASSSRR
jgi:hypothetical protein